MLTEKDYCDYETCVALEELGFPIRRIKVKEKEKHVPILLYEAHKWLREEHQLHIEVRYYQNLWYEYELKEAEGKILAEGSAFKTYEDALSTAVYMATEHLKGKKYGRM